MFRGKYMELLENAFDPAKKVMKKMNFYEPRLNTFTNQNDYNRLPAFRIFGMTTLDAVKRLHFYGYGLDIRRRRESTCI